VLAEPCLFGDYKTVGLPEPPAEPGLRLYEDLGSYEAVKPLWEHLLGGYNAKQKPMQLIFFEDALEHLTRIERTLRLPQASERGGK
jgi:dynein heavy chain